ncbi:MAG: hypothetical protein GY937_14295 [bacterium]|nr:hypothetical protein [bacterium]
MKRSEPTFLCDAVGRLSVGCIEELRDAWRQVPCPKALGPRQLPGES